MMSTFANNKMMRGHDDETQALPGFRFHPTDEEVVEFYLRRKVNKKPMKIDHLIQQIDIYKHDPWDLPKINDGEDTKEFYFFCRRGRKYRNSIRPNRVTGSGFWKATGIDKQVCSNRECIGLKKTLVYYRGSAGKGTKTDWMMHEFRLPNPNSASDKCTTHEAEVWTVCRIFNRNLPHKKYVGDWSKPSSKQVISETKTPAFVIESDTHEAYISFGPRVQYYDNKRSTVVVNQHTNQNNNNAHLLERKGIFNHSPISVGQAPSASTSSSSYFNTDDQQMEQQFTYENNWDELGSVVELAFEEVLITPW